MQLTNYGIITIFFGLPREKTVPLVDRAPDDTAIGDEVEMSSNGRTGTVSHAPGNRRIDVR
ncbi:hypothetical protein M514_07890 [Trichuris suis]|uniref:Uncharacterized protein n=1 Tax=Trichuris suis TaxID=68888 RepID=A0A085M244_9BILA|nr:hypothetical protein M513_07890 [Trichuris suis]KFD63905.1 hypothetical protein M514_07890 [Trichuris suis]